MGLIVVYVLIIIVGDLIAWGIGRFIDQIFPAVSLPVFLAMFFAVFWLGWMLAVRVTEPRHSGN